MSGTITDLYLKYVEDLNKNLEDDRYFRYLFELIQASDNVISQQHQVLHKVVDEKWISIIEDCLDPLNRIIDKPRRFIERNEEVVPVSLAKKITSDSVRHLSMNTQFIACADEDNIQPTHILNVSVDESFDLYENRFIYHLIQRLVTFVDKRTDIIFWSTGDETQNTITMESNIDDAYEQIQYKLEMKVKNMQSTAENDSDNMDVFMRIDRVRRLVMALKYSSFCEIMAGCQKVRSPIQRTNLLTKDPDYRKCYQLWQFLESYDEVGYTIDVQESALEFDEEYLIQMYTNLINNYTVFKSITEPDTRDIDAAGTRRHRVIKPRFVKEITEEIVTDYNIEEAEVRQVIVEEVTQAQLDAEAKLAEVIEEKKEVEKALSEAEASARHSMIQAEYAMSAKTEAEEIAKEAEDKVKEIEARLAKERSDKEDAYLIIQEKDELIAAKDEQLGTDALGFMNQLEEQRAHFEERIEEINNAHELKLAEVRDECQNMVETTELQFIEKMDKQEEETAGEIEAIQIRSEEKLNRSIEDFDKQLAIQTEESAAMLAEKTAMYEDVMEQQQAEYNKSLSEQKENFTGQLTELQTSYEQRLSDMEAEYAAHIDDLKKEAEASLAKHIADNDKALKEERAEASKKYIELEKASHDAYVELRKVKDDELLTVRKEASDTLKKEKEEADNKFKEYKKESTEKYNELRNKSKEELSTTKQKAQDKYNKTVEKAQHTEAKLQAEIERLMQANKELTEENKKTNELLGQEKKARISAETAVSSEKMLREAAELKVTAKTMGEFMQALRLERKANRKK